MNKITLSLTAFLFCLGLNSVVAQDNMEEGYTNVLATPEYKWEAGIGLGHTFLNGDLDFRPGFGASLHLRRALDYIFSIRGEAGFASYNGGVESPSANDKRPSDYEVRNIYGALHGIISLNNLKWDQDVRKTDFYAFAGAALGTESSEVTIGGNVSDPVEDLSSSALVMADGGAGLSFRISEKVNVGIEHKVSVPFGRKADILDGWENRGSTVTTYRDIFHYTSVKLNFNLGGDDKAEPLYWLNPLDLVLQDISELKARPVFDLTDTDGDGIIDMIDQEKESPEGARVDTRGVTLDSDGDGVPDATDKEPFSPIGYDYDADGVAQVPPADFTTPAMVQSMIDKALADYDLTANKGSLANWFLPIIHFDLDSYRIKTSEITKLANVAQVLRGNPNIRVVATGFTDRTATDAYNNVLSYNRAKSAMDYLITNFGISPDRLVLNWRGETDNLVPTNGTSYMNRRVEFKVATNETNMSRPEGRNAGKGPRFDGSRNSGY